jgi:hypothetical protein
MEVKLLKILISLAALFLAVNVSFAQQKIYQWTDQDGTVHFTSSPPPAGVQAEEKPMEQIPMVGTTTSNPGAGKQQQSDALVQLRCEQSAILVEKLERLNHVVVEDRDGSSRIMDEAEQQERIDHARSYMDEFCDQQTDPAG